MQQSHVEHKSTLPKPRLIRVFLASPGDVRDERKALGELISEINETLTFLAPEKRLQVELISYETHAFPDVGAPQQVINRQIPVDYEILIGIMWRRCGTPTGKYASGTIEEFWRAYECRQKNGTPTIMFYFCDEAIPIPNSEELKQLEGVVKFREELAPLGYIGNYPTRENFRHFVRSGLLRAIRSVLRVDPMPGPTEEADFEVAPVENSARESYIGLAAEYDHLGRTMPSGNARTRLMTTVFSRMTTMAGGVAGLLLDLQSSSSPGQRLGAIAILHMFPNVQHLDWLAERLDPDKETPFVGFHAAGGLLQAIRSLPQSDCKKLAKSLSRARELAERLTTDPPRLRVLDTADRELRAKCSVH